jgi:hypothetical protein
MQNEHKPVKKEIGSHLELGEQVDVIVGQIRVRAYTFFFE